MHVKLMRASTKAPALIMRLSELWPTAYHYLGSLLQSLGREAIPVPARNIRGEN